MRDWILMNLCRRTDLLIPHHQEPDMNRMMVLSERLQKVFSPLKPLLALLVQSLQTRRYVPFFNLSSYNMLNSF